MSSRNPSHYLFLSKGEGHNNSEKIQLTLRSFDDNVTNMENNERIGGYDHESKRFTHSLN
jgi:hypothetical protein